VRRGILAVIVAAGLWGLLCSCSHAAVAWDITTVENLSGSSSLSIGVDSTGKAHLSYLVESSAGSTGYSLKYATNRSGAWIAQTIDGSGSVRAGNAPFLALDPQDKVHIAYYDSTHGTLKYATNVSGTWVASTVDTSYGPGSLAVDSTGAVHIAYFGPTGLTHATKESGSWVASTISAVVSDNVSIAIGPGDKVHISYFVDVVMVDFQPVSVQDLKYATNASGAWATSTVDSVGFVGYDNHIAVDANGKAHISYYNNNIGSLSYATNASGAWAVIFPPCQSLTLGLCVAPGTDNSIAVDSKHAIHISAASRTSVWYLTNSSGVWGKQVVDSQGDTRFAAIAVDATGHVHIAYGLQDDSGALAELRYATNNPAGTASLVAAVLPSSRSVQVHSAATAFATIINSSPLTATDCGIAPVSIVPATFTYQTTDPATNALTGTPNTPVSIPAGQLQTYVFAFTPTAAFSPTDVQLSFDCTNSNPALIISGLDTLLLSASEGPVADIVALAATIDNDGIVNIPGPTGTGVFAVATMNVGATDSITATADTGAGSLAVTIALCETNPATGFCLGMVGSSVPTRINAGQTPTFGIFITGTGTVPFDPANNRVFVRFTDGGGVTRGATSVAVRTQ
jgi:hypothetical protein